MGVIRRAFIALRNFGTAATIFLAFSGDGRLIRIHHLVRLEEDTPMASAAPLIVAWPFSHMVRMAQSAFGGSEFLCGLIDFVDVFIVEGSVNEIFFVVNKNF